MACIAAASGVVAVTAVVADAGAVIVVNVVGTVVDVDVGAA